MIPPVSGCAPARRRSALFRGCPDDGLSRPMARMSVQAIFNVSERRSAR